MSITEQRNHRDDPVPATPGANPTALPDPTAWAFRILWLGFTVAPILFGIDKFLDWMVDWEIYLWSGLVDGLPGSASEIMVVVGVIEIVAGLLVAVAPRYGSLVVAGWLGGIITNLVITSLDDTTEYWDIALRDFGLFLAALALAALAVKHARPGIPVVFGARRDQDRLAQTGNVDR